MIKKKKKKKRGPHPRPACHSVTNTSRSLSSAARAIVSPRTVVKRQDLPFANGSFFFFFFKQKTAYEIPKRDWSSDVCSSDLVQCFVGNYNSQPKICLPVSS